MNDRNTPSAADPLEDLLDRIDVGDRLADEIERLLNETGGPVPVPDEQVTAAVASVRHRLRLDPIPDARVGRGAVARGRWAVAALAAAAVLAVGAWTATSWRTGGAPGPEEVEAVQEASLTGIGVRPDSLFTIRHDTVLLADGVVSVDHGGAAGVDGGSVHRVRLASLDVVVEPVGTVYYVGIRAGVAAVWVEQGSVRLVHDTQGHLGEVGSAGWAILVRHPDADGIEVHRIADGPFDPDQIGIGDSGVAQLMADMRWMALPAQARTDILGGPGAP